MDFIASLSPRARGIACVLFSVLVWSGWMVLSSYSVRGTLSAFDITALRFGTAGVLLLPILWRKGLRIGPYGIWGGPILAMLMGAPYNTIAIMGMKFAPASHAAGIINTTMLCLTTLGAIFLLREKTTPLRIAGILLSITGIVCLLDANSGTGTVHDNMARGHMLFLVGGAMWAGYAVTMKAWKVDPLHATAAVCCYSALLFMPVYFLFVPSHIGLGNWHEALFQAVYQGIINSIFALLCFNQAIRLLGASISSAFLPLIPVLATLAAIPMLHETPGPQELIGLCFAAGGVMLSTGIAERFRRARLPA